VIKRTLEISREAAHLAVRNEQLLLKRDGQIVGQIPCEDLGMVVVDHPCTTYSHHALVTLAEAGAAVVLCGRDHLPTALVLPLADHTQVVWRLADQIAASLPLKKRLWQQLVVAKIEGQARNLLPGLPAHKKLRALAREVRSGDPTNIEAQAAKIYWRNWLATDDPAVADTEPFRRDQNASGVNSFLNYGYAILRAALGRAIVAAGLQPGLGLHHSGRSNAFCLADDLIEPFRPLVDDRVRDMHSQGYETLNQPAKAELLELLTLTMRLPSRSTPNGNGSQASGDQTGPLMVMLHRQVASLVRCYAGEARRIEVPIPSIRDQSEASTTSGSPTGTQETTPCESQDTD